MEDDGVFGIQLLLLPASRERVETSIHRIKRGGLQCFSSYINRTGGVFLASTNVCGISDVNELMSSALTDDFMAFHRNNRGAINKLVVVCQSQEIELLI